MLYVIVATIFFISDAQIDNTNAETDSVAAAISSRIGAEVVYDCGDLVEHGGFLEEYEYARYAELFSHCVPVPGNHDHYDGLEYFPWPRVVDEHRDGAHIVGFDSNYRADAGMMQWLRDTLDDGPQTATIFYIHHQIYSDNLRNGGISHVMRDAFESIVIDTGVDLVVSGHGHAYERHEANGGRVPGDRWSRRPAG